MPDQILPIGPGKPTDPSKPKAPDAPLEGERSFKQILEDAINRVNQLQVDADDTLTKFYNGEASIDEVAVQFRKAQIAFEMLMQVRNRLVDAFEELMRMRI